jgi:hypothetical protein
MEILSKVQNKEFWDGLTLAIAIFSGLTTVLLGLIAWLIGRYVTGIDKRLDSHSKSITEVKEATTRALSWISITESQEESRQVLEAQRTADLHQVRQELHQLNNTLLTTVIPAAFKK